MSFSKCLLFFKTISFHLEGNECRTLLRRTDLLNDLIPAAHYKFVKAFETFNAVVSSCFGNVLDPNYPMYIHNFEQAYKDLGISVPPKVHMLIEHTNEELEKYGVGLGEFHDQGDNVKK
jgi:hypothetical protein